MEEQDSFDITMDEVEMVIKNTERFPDDEEVEVTGPGNDPQAKSLTPEVGEQEEVVQNDQHMKSSAVGSLVSGKTSRKRSALEMIDFKPRGRSDYGALTAGDFWALLERDLRLTNVDHPEKGFPTITMPKYTIETVRALLESSYGYKKKRAFHSFGMKGLTEADLVIIENFMKVVESTRIIGLNTEGQNRHHPSLRDSRGNPFSLVTVAVANLSGTILFFLDGLKMPEKLQIMLTDVSIYKLGSGLQREGEELAQINIKLRGWAESGALYRAFLKKETRFGIKAQTEYLNSLSGTRGLFEYFPYKHWWGKHLEKGEPGYIPWECYPHLSMNVRVPIAIACAVVIKFAEDRNLPGETFAFPILWEGLDLVRAKSAAQLENISSDLRGNWIAALPEGDQDSRAQRLENCREMTFTRRAHADFVEVLAGFDSPDLKSAEAYRMYLDSPGEGFLLPKTEVGRGGRGRQFIEQRCSFCGSHKHQTDKCVRVRAGMELRCDYEHDGLTDLKPHTIRTCPVLHGHCNICFQRGHHPRAHQNKEFTQRQLRERFLRGQPCGLLTSILYLAVRPEGRKKINSALWRFGLMAGSFRKDAVSRHHLKIPAGACLGVDPDQTKLEASLREGPLVKKIDAVQFNAKLSNPLNAIPVPRFLIQQEVDRALSAAEESAKSSTKKRTSILDRLGPPVENRVRESSPTSGPSHIRAAWSAGNLDNHWGDGELNFQEEENLMAEDEFVDTYLEERTVSKPDEEDEMPVKLRKVILRNP